MKAKTLKFLIIALCFSGAIVTWLGFGERGLIHLYRTEDERKELAQRIHELKKENHALLEEVHRLRTDMGYIESAARKQLNLIKSNEIIYVFDKAKTHNTDNSEIFKGSGQAEQNIKPERKVGPNEKIK